MTRGAALAAAVVIVGCAPTLTPQQEHAYKAVEDRGATALQRDWTYWVLPNGSIRFSGRGDGLSLLQECLTTKYGYKF